MTIVSMGAKVGSQIRFTPASIRAVCPGTEVDGASKCCADPFFLPNVRPASTNEQ
jgi:hypothetical protein